MSIPRIWNSMGVRIWLSGADARGTYAGQPCFTGIAEKDNCARTILWEAWPLPQGYAVTVTNDFSGAKEQFQGATLNLALEVAHAINRAGASICGFPNKKDT